MDAEIPITEPPTRETIEKVRRLLDDLGHIAWPHAPYRMQAMAAAEKELQAMGIEAAYAIQAIYKTRVDELHKRNVIGMKLLPWIPVIFLLLLGPLLFFGNLLGAVLSSLVALACLGAIFWYLRKTVAENVSLSRRLRLTRSIRFIAGLHDKHTIPILMDLQLMGENLGAADARQALIQLLPTLEEDDAPLLSSEYRHRLNSFLTTTGSVNMQHSTVIEPAYQVAALRALANVGDASSLHTVERLASALFPSPVRQAARDCLPRLKQRIEAQGQTLLRPSASTGPGDGLLRAAGNAETEKDHLLRAHPGEQDC